VSRMSFLRMIRPPGERRAPMPSSKLGAAEDTDGVGQVRPSSSEQGKWRAKRSDGCADRSKCSSERSDGFV
jgi:hypothetical protein